MPQAEMLQGWLLAATLSMLQAVSLATLADPAATTGNLVRELDLQAQQIELQAGQRRQLARVPDQQQTAALFTQAMGAPFAFERPLQDFSRRLLPGEVEGPGYIKTRLLREWVQQYAGHSTCELAPLLLPADLEQALQQVVELGQAVRARQTGAAGSRQRARLARDFPKVMALMQNPQPANMSWWERRRLKRFAANLAVADVAALACAARHWLLLTNPDWLSALRKLMLAHPNAASSLIMRRATPLGDIVLGGLADSRVTSDAPFFLVDIGGNDFYGLEAAASFDGTPQLIIDFSGNDLYESSKAGGYAAGLGRMALLWDLAGDDRYQAAELSQGVAWLGVGVLIDDSGNDTYSAHNYAQGMAWQGVGLLLDRDGTDRYQLAALGQGLGMQLGMGLLLDQGGDDQYLAKGGVPSLYGTPGLSDAWAQGVGLGLRGVTSGGLGLLVDSGGSDLFDAGNFAQGGAYYRSVGMLLDLNEGDDSFLGSRYSAAWGAHGGIGYLFNESGDDNYYTRHSAMAAAAWDYSLAYFSDGAGDDNYRFGDFSLGSSAHNSVAWFLDEAGADNYSGSQPAMADKGVPNFSLFLDLDSSGDQLNGLGVTQGCEVSAASSVIIWRELQDLPRCRIPQ
ncbi:MAG: hypothetical protein ABJ308_02535 [Halieaceae bacterium]